MEIKAFATSKGVGPYLAMIAVVARGRNTQRSLQVHQLMLVDGLGDEKRDGEGRLISCGLIYVTFSDGLIIFALLQR